MIETIKGQRVIVRPELREEACRMFEGTMMQAILSGEVMVNPRDFGRWSPRTFISRFTDAKKGFMDFKYKLAFEREKLKQIHAYELENCQIGVVYKGPKIDLTIDKVGRVITREEFEEADHYVKSMDFSSDEYDVEKYETAFFLCEEWRKNHPEDAKERV